MTKRANSHVVSPHGGSQSGRKSPPLPGHRGTKPRQLPRSSGPPCPLAPHRGADLARGGGGLWRLAGAHLVPPCAALVARPAIGRLADRLARRPAARDHPRPSHTPALGQHGARHGADRALAALSPLPQPPPQPSCHAAPHGPSGRYRELLRGARALAAPRARWAASAEGPQHPSRPAAIRPGAHNSRLLAGGRRAARPRRAGMRPNLGHTRGADGAGAGLGAGRLPASRSGPM